MSYLALSALLMLGGASARSIQYDTVVGDFSAYKGGLYQSAFDNKTNSLFVTSSIGRAPVNTSDLLKVDATTLKVDQDYHAQFHNNATGVLAVYGISFDTKTNRVWTSNTRQNTISSYNAANLSDVHTFPDNSISHPREVYYDPKTGFAYAGTPMGDFLMVYQANDTSANVQKLNLSEITGKNMSGIMSLSVDHSTRTLYTVSMRNAFAAAINLDDHTGQAWSLGNVSRASGVAIDTKRKHLFVTNQGSNSTVILDTNTGKVLETLQVPGGPLSAVYDPMYDLVYVACRTGSKVSVIDASDYSTVAQLNVTTPNHVALGANGSVFVTDKSTASNLFKFTPKKVTNSSASNSSSSAPEATNSAASFGIPVAGVMVAAAAMLI